jgi:hypothetical protein
MIDSTHCSRCDALLIEIDFYGARLVGCIECNRMDPRWVALYPPAGGRLGSLAIQLKRRG